MTDTVQEASARLALLRSPVVDRLIASRGAILSALGVFCVLFFVGLIPAWAALFGGLLVLGAAAAIPDVASRDETEMWDPGLRDSPAVETLLEALLEPAVLLTSRGTVHTFNHAAGGILGNLKKGEPISFSLRVPDVLAAVREVAAGGSGQVVEYVERVPVDRWIEARIGPVRSDPAGNGPPDFIMLALHDLTHLRRAERMRVDFVANASHELRTPLAALLGFIETLQGPARDDLAARGRFLDIMKAQAGRMSRLIDDLLSLSRIEQRQHVRPLGRVDLVEITRSVLDSLAPLAAEKNVRITTRFEPPHLPAQGDRDEIVRVAENLIENAIKYGQAGGRVEVSVSAEGDEARVSVRDHGPGIAPEHLPRLTERFYRVDAGDSREKGGTGLGLAIVKHIMARHRGRLLIDSTVGQGACFTAVFDLREEETA